MNRIAKFVTLALMLTGCASRVTPPNAPGAAGEFPKAPCTVAEFWPVYAQSQAPAKWCPNGCAGYPDKLDIGAIRTVNGKTEIIYSRTPTEDNALSGEWIPFDGSNQAH